MGLIRAGIVGGKTNSTARPGTDESGSNRAERQIFFNVGSSTALLHTKAVDLCGTYKKV